MQENNLSIKPAVWKPIALPPQLFSSVSDVRSSRGTSSQLSQSGSEARTSPPPTLPVSQVTGDSWIFILNVCTTMREQEKSAQRHAEPVNTLFKLSSTLPQAGPALREGLLLAPDWLPLLSKHPPICLRLCVETAGVDWLLPVLPPTGIPHPSLTCSLSYFSLSTVVLRAFSLAWHAYIPHPSAALDMFVSQQQDQKGGVDGC